MRPWVLELLEMDPTPLQRQFSPYEAEVPDDGQLLTEAEVCQLCPVSREAVRRARLDPVDPIPTYKFKRQYLYKKSQVLRWMQRSAQRAYL